jgi:hypothetical protein
LAQRTFIIITPDDAGRRKGTRNTVAQDSSTQRDSTQGSSAGQ